MHGRIEVSVNIDAPPDVVWAAIEPIERHVEWMSDAEAITFETSQRRGAGTRFRCDTRIGPIHLVDAMEVTGWNPGMAMGVRHTGIVTGTGTFTLTPIDLERRTRFSWNERLHFPWWLGGPAGAAIAAATVLPMVWRRNLATLRRIIEANR